MFEASLHPAARIPLRLLAALVACAAILGACGGGEVDDRTQISDTLRKGLTTNDPQLLCKQTLTPALAARIYGSIERCLVVEQAASAGRGGAQRAATVSRVKVQGDRGSAHIIVTGGGPPGAGAGPDARGGLQVVRNKAGWRLSQMSHEFLRSVLKAGLVGNPDVGEALAACLAARVDALDDSTLQRMAYGAMGGVPDAGKQMGAMVTACVQGPGTPKPGDIA